MFNLANQTGTKLGASSRIRIKRANGSFRSFGALTAFCLGLAMAFPLMTGTAVSADANSVFSECTFDQAQLKAALTTSDSGNPKVTAENLEASYIVIYTRANPNNGQAIKDKDGNVVGHTGAVVCVNAATDFASASAESVPIPNGVNHSSTVTSVDILATQGGSILQYELNAPAGDASDGIVENRVCLSTDTGVDCVLVQPQ